MKITAIVIALLICTSATAPAKDCYTSKEGKKICTEWNAEKGYLEITANGAMFRAYPCGQMDKMKWETISPNLEPLTCTNLTNSITLTTPATLN